ncbi:hypothetical protein BT63DRAFT_421458 [Microthyrium microscopicum]|uniref:Tcp11-domain-containing protein n=1 Tax=Microthyrium microscopicum TaxID=703497 RepID=A0A6A6UPB8_9PEZI|nr:hypothetical protein BT63DRAFT_421458 [Microthyrium microscopicum]
MDGNPPPPVAEMDVPDRPTTHDDIPEESDGLTSPLSPDSGPTFGPPPARLAARFYRPSAASRRKSSAASSRRNSLSSQQSVQSNSSYRQACRQNHVAQYLRRASIIESRKARLAAREAHADQVRLRAALARTAPRSSNSEERALAAKQARDERLGQIAATCAEEVRRAKRIAEETKERRAAEEERYRVEMEEKLADAEKRRIEYYKKNLRRPRTASTPPNADIKKAIIKEMSDEERERAVTRLQRVWRINRRSKAFDEFSQLGLSIDKVHNTTFDDIKERLCDHRVLEITSKVLNLLQIRSTEADVQDPHATTKTFLTAYLLLGHPAQVMSQDGEQEQDVIQKAKDLIISFEAALSKATAENKYTTPSTSLEDIHLTYTAYLTAFSDWKTKDKTILIELLVQDFVNLDAIWQTVKDDSDGKVADDYQSGIRENQVFLLARLRKLAGPDRANLLIRKAIRDSRRQKQAEKRKLIGDVRPRAADADKIHPEPSTGEESTPTVETAQLTPKPPQSDAIQTKSISQIFSVMPSNRVVTHELVIDKDYRIDTSPHTKARDEVHRKICDSMRDAFKKGEGDRWTVATAENVRAKLLHLLVGSRGEGSLYHLISEALDPELIQRQCSQGIFSYQNFFSFIATILPKLCAPVRDEEVKALAEDLQQFGSLEEMIEKLFKLFHIIDVLALDYSNFLLSNVAARLIKEAPGYEQRMFARELNEGKITLLKTKRWWNNASVNVLTEADRLDPSYRPTLQKIYARGLVDLAVATPPLRDNDVPETLELDKSRLERIREQSVRVTIVGTILLSAKNLLKRDVRSQWKSEANRLLDILKTGYTDDAQPARVLSVIDTAHTLPPATKAQLGSTIARLLSQAATGRFTDPVAKVLFQRLKTHIFSRISASSSGERVRAVSTASESLSTAGLPEFGNIVGGLVDLLSKVGDADRKSHGIWYEKIAAENEDDAGETMQTETDGATDSNENAEPSSAA